MVEWLELRVLEEQAHRVFAPNEGKRLGSGTVRRIHMRTDDPRMRDVETWQRRLRAEGRSLFLGWDYVRRYRAAEMLAARAFLVCRLPRFEPEGESCGTIYDDRVACVCGVPRRQVGPLRLRRAAIGSLSTPPVW